MEQKSTKSNKVAIRVILDEEVARKFNIIKSHKGIKNNTEIIRLLIAEEFARSA